MTYELIGVPFSSMASAGGIAEAGRVLREYGLTGLVAGSERVVDGGELTLPDGDGRRAPSGLLNEDALVALVEATRAATLESLGRGRRPLFVGGDCPVLLGPLAAARDRGLTAGLVHVDGHEDAWPPRLSPTGEASDSEIWIALGSDPVELPDPLRALMPLLEFGAMAMLGPRDRAEIEAAGLFSLGDEVAFFGDDADLRRGPATAARAAIEAIDGATSGFWLHLDLDVLSSEALAAVDYRQPGGIGWDQLAEVAADALADERCLGASVAIYNPDLDPDRSGARRTVDFIAELTSA